MENKPEDQPSEIRAHLDEVVIEIQSLMASRGIKNYTVMVAEVEKIENEDYINVVHAVKGSGETLVNALSSTLMNDDKFYQLIIESVLSARLLGTDEKDLEKLK